LIRLFSVIEVNFIFVFSAELLNIEVRNITTVLKLLIKEMNVEECDATQIRRDTKAGYIKIKS